MANRRVTLIMCSAVRPEELEMPPQKPTDSNVVPSSFGTMPSPRERRQRMLLAKPASDWRPPTEDQFLSSERALVRDDPKAGLGNLLPRVRRADELPTHEPELLVGMLEADEHTLLYGPGGCGKTTLAAVVARDLCR